MSRLLNILALVLTFAVLISASPTPYTEDKLFEIDTLRARGISEVSHALCPFICLLPIMLFPAISFIKKYLCIILTGPDRRPHLQPRFSPSANPRPCP